MVLISMNSSTLSPCWCWVLAIFTLILMFQFSSQCTAIACSCRSSKELVVKLNNLHFHCLLSSLLPLSLISSMSSLPSLYSLKTAGSL